MDQDYQPQDALRLRTSGGGCWSRVRKDVRITLLSVMNPDETYRELRVYFNPTDWNINVDGLIYSDPGFEKGFRAMLKSIGLPEDDVHYSEQGMQGVDYVSMDCGETFTKAFADLVAQ